MTQTQIWRCEGYTLALNDDSALKSLEFLDAIADTVSGPVADLLLSKVKKGGTFASVLASPSNAAAHPEVRTESMQVKPGPTTLVHMAKAVKAGKVVIPLGQRFALADAGKAHLAAEKTEGETYETDRDRSSSLERY